jgi:prepilin-type N-terminal cleavage/methylation domain-containing protein
MMKRGFTILELLIVTAIISLLMAIMMPVLSKVREQAKVVVVNGELYGIGVALESYAMDNENKYPPSRVDCNPEARKHAYALPQELVDRGYLPKGGEIGRVSWTKIEDKFNKGCTYKYIAVGPKYDFFGVRFINQYLKVPEGFPDQEGGDLIKYDDPKKSLVTWVLFSVGPRCNKQRVEQGNFPLIEGYPVSREFWYSPETRKGAITRMRLKKGYHIGSFEDN